MKLSFNERTALPVGVLALLTVLAVLAVLQYRWTQELSEAASDRLRAGLQSSMMGLREDLTGELATLSAALQSEGISFDPSTSAPAYAERFEAWKRTAAHPELVSNVFVWRFTNGLHPQLLRLNVERRQFEAANVPPQFEQIQQPLRLTSSEMAEMARLHREIRNSSINRFVRPALPWFIEEQIPALLHAEIAGIGVDWVIIELNQNVIQQQLFPDLAQRYFGSPKGLVYDVAVLARNRKLRVLYSSNSQFGTGTNIPTDGRINLFGPPFSSPGPPRSMFLPARTPGPSDATGTLSRGGRGGVRTSFRFEPFRYTAQDGDWELIVKHRKGSLEAALTSMRWRHLAISFGVLGVLAVTMGLIIVATRRAQRLARLQMDFVAGISHELRTPLAVIDSAAANIADGIVEDKTKVIRYGKVIQNQAHQLSRLVEQTLLFAATRQNRYQYNLNWTQPSEIVSTALSNSSELIRSVSFTIEQHVDPELPLVLVDLPAVSQCLQNLISNAIKYSGDSRWMAITARHCADNGEVQIAVEDKGIGIEDADLKRIFDPFYRSPGAVGAQIHGTGLGLALAKGIAEDMGGSLTVTSAAGHGSTFVLHLPSADEYTSTGGATTSTAMPAGTKNS